jgi:hypothetical protein
MPIATGFPHLPTAPTKAHPGATARKEAIRLRAAGITFEMAQFERDALKEQLDRRFPDSY